MNANIDQVAKSELISLLRSASNRSIRALYAAFLLSIAVYILTLTPLLFRLGILTPYLPSSKMDSILDMSVALAFVVQLISHLLQLRSEYLAELAQEVRHLCFISNGLGGHPPDSALLTLRLRIPPAKKIFDTKKYYSSDMPAGPGRLKDIVLESAIFTSELARKAAMVLWTFTAVVALTILIAFVLTVQNTSLDHTRILAEFLMISLGFWLAGDLGHLAFRYQRLSVEATAARTFCYTLTEVNLGQAYDALILYLSSTSHAPPIPPLIYSIHAGFLNTAIRSPHSS